MSLFRALIAHTHGRVEPVHSAIALETHAEILLSKTVEGELCTERLPFI